MVTFLITAQCPSNSIGSQFYCIIGARESYIKAINAGSWQGFDKTNLSEIKELLEVSLKNLGAIEFNTLDGDQQNIAFDLLEHEIQHHGQLIRYFYANKLKFPKSWNE